MCCFPGDLYPRIPNPDRSIINIKNKFCNWKESAERKPEVQLIPVKMCEKPEFLATVFLIYKPNSIFVLIINNVFLCESMINIFSYSFSIPYNSFFLGLIKYNINNAGPQIQEEKRNTRPKPSRTIKEPLMVPVPYSPKLQILQRIEY